MASSIGHYLAGILDSFKFTRRCLPWQHTWEDVLTDVPTCLSCMARQLIPREPFNFGD